MRCLSCRRSIKADSSVLSWSWVSNAASVWATIARRISVGLRPRAETAGWYGRILRVVSGIRSPCVTTTPAMPATPGRQTVVVTPISDCSCGRGLCKSRSGRSIRASRLDRFAQDTSLYTGRWLAAVRPPRTVNPCETRHLRRVMVLDQAKRSAVTCFSRNSRLLRLFRLYLGVDRKEQ